MDHLHRISVIFPDNAQIRKHAKELRLMEALPLAEFLELYEPRLKPEKKAIIGTPKPIPPPPNTVALDRSQQQIMHRALRRSLWIIG